MPFEIHSRTVSEVRKSLSSSFFFFFFFFPSLFFLSIPFLFSFSLSCRRERQGGRERERENRLMVALTRFVLTSKHNPLCSFVCNRLTHWHVLDERVSVRERRPAAPRRWMVVGRASVMTTVHRRMELNQPASQPASQISNELTIR